MTSSWPSRNFRMRLRKEKEVRSRKANLDNTLIYVIVLSCVDFGVCLSLPLTVIDQILGFWPFGVLLCKLHAVLENFGKILSALILTAMSFDRFAGVCHPQKKWLRSTKFAVCILLGLAAYALVTLCPLLWSFTANEVILFEKETALFKITRMRIEKCTMMSISSQIFTMFTIFLFVLCYLVPLFLVTFFYSRLLGKLRQHARQFTASHIPLMRISLYTLAVACFYFLCWTPFWVATAFAVYLEYFGEKNTSVPPGFVYCMYFIHALPFTNSAVNWMLYGALNSQLQHRYRGGRGAETVTLMANGNSTVPNDDQDGAFGQRDQLAAGPLQMSLSQCGYTRPSNTSFCLRSELRDENTQTELTSRHFKSKDSLQNPISDDSTTSADFFINSNDEATFL
ncbi:putative G-protein coupled receptor C06G4.5 [Aphelenchoides fujianensis]|nr:putative G-protein coupled receptor C06G4.5 [Aphelenchoides fujianensis]